MDQAEIETTIGLQSQVSKRSKISIIGALHRYRHVKPTKRPSQAIEIALPSRTIAPISLGQRSACHQSCRNKSGSQARHRRGCSRRSGLAFPLCRIACPRTMPPAPRHKPACRARNPIGSKARREGWHLRLVHLSEKRRFIRRLDCGALIRRKLKIDQIEW